jgi:hypothetical protein
MTPVLFLEIPDVLGGAAAFRAFATRHIGKNPLSGVRSVSAKKEGRSRNWLRLSLASVRLSLIRNPSIKIATPIVLLSAMNICRYLPHAGMSSSTEDGFAVDLEDC